MLKWGLWLLSLWRGERSHNGFVLAVHFKWPVERQGVYLCCVINCVLFPRFSIFGCSPQSTTRPFSLLFTAAVLTFTCNDTPDSTTCLLYHFVAAFPVYLNYQEVLLLIRAWFPLTKTQDPLGPVRTLERGDDMWQRASKPGSMQQGPSLCT